MLIFFWNVINIHIYIYITCDYKPWAYPWRNHNVFTKPPKLQTGPRCEVHWIDGARMLWRSLMNFGLWMRDAVQSVPGFLPAATPRLRFRSDFKTLFLGHIPCVSYSCFFLSNASVSTSILFAESQCMSYIYMTIYIYVHRSFVVTCTISHVYTYIIIYIHTLHYITIHYITLHYITLHYTTLHYITLHYITLNQQQKLSTSKNPNLRRPGEGGRRPWLDADAAPRFHRNEDPGRSGGPGCIISEKMMATILHA